MAIWKTEYRVDAELPIKAQTPVEPALLGQRFPVQPPSVTITSWPKTLALEVGFSRGTSAPTDMQVMWRFEELYTDGSVNETSGDSQVAESRHSKILTLPADEKNIWPIRVFSVIEPLFELLSRAVQAVSVRARSPRFLRAFFGCRSERLARAIVTVEGQTIDVEPAGWWGRPSVSDFPLDQHRLTTALSSPAHEHEWHIAMADFRIMESDLRGAITNLTTAMEVAAYAFARRVAPGERLPDFNPKRYFETTDPRTPVALVRVLRARPISAAALSQLKSLWGTRHEIVHNGQLKMRPSRATPPNRQDYFRFRENLSLALDWMGFPPIQ